MRKKNILNSPRLLDLKKKRRKALLFKIILYFLIFSIVFGFLSYLSNFKSLNIDGVVIKGNEIAETGTIQTIVEQTLAGKYFWLFPKTNVLIYPKNSIKNNLLDSFKRIEKVEITIENNQTLMVVLTEREAKYMWCGDVPPNENKNDQECYFLDKNGYVFNKAPYFSGEVYFRFYGKINEPLGSYFSKQNFNELISFKEALVNLGLKPIALYIINNDEGNIFLSKGLSSNSEPKIIFNPNSDFQIIEENLDAALNTEPLKSKFKDKYSSLQYIDLRFGNKVYHKFQ